ncbi:MAG: hypothetical protein ACI391_03520 [Muribaculaceae bacterium]
MDNNQPQLNNQAGASAQPSTSPDDNQPAMYESLTPPVDCDPEPDVSFLQNYQPHSFWYL